MIFLIYVYFYAPEFTLIYTSNGFNIYVKNYIRHWNIIKQFFLNPAVNKTIQSLKTKLKNHILEHTNINLMDTKRYFSQSYYIRKYFCNIWQRVNIRMLQQIGKKKMSSPIEN